MDSDGKFWLGIWSVIGIIFIIVMSMTFRWSSHRNTLISDAIKSGVHPVDARYAFHVGTSAQDALTILRDKISENSNNGEK